MDSQNKSVSPSSPSIDPEEARRRFLESMGIVDSQPKETLGADETVENEEVVLSSVPENLELPGATPQAPGREQNAPLEMDQSWHDRSVEPSLDPTAENRDISVAMEPVEDDSVKTELEKDAGIAPVNVPEEVPDSQENADSLAEAEGVERMEEVQMQVRV